MLLHLKELFVGIFKLFKLWHDVPEVVQGFLLEDGVEDNISDKKSAWLILDELSDEFLPWAYWFCLHLEGFEAEFEGD